MSENARDVSANGGVTTKADLSALLDLNDTGAGAGGVEFFDTQGLTQFLLPSDKSLNRPLILGDDIVLVQADGSVVVLANAVDGAFVIRSGELTLAASELGGVAKPEDDWSLISDADAVDLSGFLDGGDALSSSVEADLRPVNQPLEGLAISPLLPPTQYSFPELREEDSAGGSQPDVGIVQIAPVLRAETDSPVSIRLSDFFEVTAGNADFGEEIVEIGVRIDNLPDGTSASSGFISGGVFTFTGTSAQFDALVLTFPTDFSTQSRIDGAPGPLPAEIFANSNFGDGPVDTFDLRILDEEDLELTGPGTLSLVETDAALTFLPSDAVLPTVTDIDGSETVTNVTLSLNGLPAGARVSFDGGASFADLGGTLAFDGTLADYAQIVVELPADFSTENPASSITGSVSATTNEGGAETWPIAVAVEATPDITVTAPALVSGVEDADSGDGSGVTVDLGLDVVVDDIDGSEDDTLVTLSFTDLPAGSSVNGGALSGQTWTGTVDQANALTLTLPGDFSGQIPVVIDATSPEGSAGAVQTIDITPTGDVDLTATPIVTAETDAAVIITPSASWVASVSDADPALPREELTEVVLVLDGLPPGVVALGVPSTVITFDAAAGGTLTFTGSEAQYTALQLSFPADYSTESPDVPSPVISGTISATSTEGSNGPLPVELRITPEGDATIDDTGADTVPDETDAPTSVTPSDLLAAQVTDADGSESIETLTLTVEGLPGNGSFTLADVSGVTPAQASLDPSTDGSLTLTVTLNAADVGDVTAAYAGVEISLPGDFSTANRSDLASATSRPLDLSLSIQTDEDQNPADDTPADGTAVATRTVDIGFTPDIELTAPATLDAEEDAGVGGDPAPGTVFDLGIEITVDDADGSETEDPSDARFAATVEVEITGLPSGSSVNTGTLTGATWSGTVAEAEALELTVAGNFSGTITGDITVTTPEGSESTSQTLTITPTPDVEVTGSISATETDAELTVPIAPGIAIDITDPSERIYEISFELPGVPAGTEFRDGDGNVLATASGGSIAITWTDADGDGFDDTTGLAFDDLVLVFPADFSTENPDVPLEATVTVTTEQNGTVLPPASAQIAVEIAAEGDVEIQGSGLIEEAETDAVVDVRPSDGLLPVPTDADTSESIETVTLSFAALPSGAHFAIGIGSFDPVPPSLSFDLTLAEYEAFLLRLPADYSTENGGSEIQATVSATTDEGGVASAPLTIQLSAEGDIEVTGTGVITLGENDPSPSSDDDGTSTDPLDFQVASALQASSPDADGSEGIEQIDVTVSGLPDGTEYSIGGAFIAAPVAADLVLTGLSPSQYAALTVRLPDDFSTESPASTISGTVTFTTDEALLAGETDVDGTDGIETRGFTVTVTSEADVEITVADITVVEDVFDSDPDPIALNLDAAVTDIDGSESVQSVTVEFSGLATSGDTVLTDGTVLTGPTASWTGNVAELQALGVASLPQHFSGVIDIDVTVVTDEGDPAGTTDSMVLNVTPVAEPEVVLSVVTAPPGVVANGPDSFVVKEDTPFLLQIDATTPDQDGSETLDQIVIDNLPPGWLPDGALDIGASFPSGAGDVQSATVSGSTITIVLVDGVATFNGTLTVTPGENEDRDIGTIVGGELTATVTATDTAAGLPDDTASASDSTDVDIDAVVDGITLETANSGGRENTNGGRTRPLEITTLTLDDNDGSESLDRLQVTLSIDTESDPFDPSVVVLQVGSGSLSAFAEITVVGTSGSQITYQIVPAGGATDAQFASALRDLDVSVPQYFSGDITTNGTVFWSETRTPTLEPGDVELDTSSPDNENSEDFSTTIRLRPVAEAELTATVFVVDPSFAADATTSLSASVKDDSTTADGTLTLLESTDDINPAPGLNNTSGPGQVSVFVGIDASTPDLDGSEVLQDVVISNVPESWIDEQLSAGTLLRSSLFSVDGSSPISDEEFGKIRETSYDVATGELTLSFNADVTAFLAAVRLQPALYEDYDVDREDGDPFTADGSFFGADLVVTATTTDSTSSRSETATASAEFDVDVDPVNNFATLPILPIGREDVIDAAGGIFSIPLDPVIRDMDGSETVTAVVIRGVPSPGGVFIRDPLNPLAEPVPALLTEIGNPPGTTTWSLENGDWENAEVHGVPLHASGEFPLTIDLITTESDGGGTGVTTLDVVFEIEPVADAGNPSNSYNAREDTAVAVPIDGNLIDNPGNSPGSPEAILDDILITNIQDDLGRFPRFFDGPPVTDPTTGEFLTDNELLPIIDVLSGLGTLTPTRAEVEDLYVVPPTDSNVPVSFNVQLIYYETVLDVAGASDPPTLVELQTLYPPEAWAIRNGTITINVEGIADAPIVEVQDADPDGATIDASLRDEFRGDDADVGGVLNQDRVYGYAAYEGTPTLLNQRLSDKALIGAGVEGDPTDFETSDVTLLSGAGSEINTPDTGAQDGSETIYYLVTGLVPPSDDGSYSESLELLGVSSVDISGLSVVATEAQLATIEVLGTPRQVPDPSDPTLSISEVTYFELELSTIVLEDDQVLPDLGGLTPDEAIATINALPGGAVTTEPFTVVIVPEPGGTGPGDCDVELDTPVFILEGSGLEDTTIDLTLRLDTTQSGNITSLQDLLDLSSPGGTVIEGETIRGDLGLGLSLPAGATLTSNPPGAVLFDPVTGLYVIDIAALGVDPGDPTQTLGVLQFTPPANEASSVYKTDLPILSDDTYGPSDPYDVLDQLQYQGLIRNFTCGTTQTYGGEFQLDVQPVADGPRIVVFGPSAIQEDTLFSPQIELRGVDLGERPVLKDVDTDSVTGAVEFFTIAVNESEGARVILDGVELSGGADAGGGFIAYEISRADTTGLRISAPEHFSGQLEYRVTSTSRDIDGSEATTQVVRSVTVIPVADAPTFEFDDSLIDPDTGLPFVDINAAAPVIQAIEDTPFLLSSVLTAESPDQDGSEVFSVVITGPADVNSYLVVGVAPGGPSDGVINNGDGSFTISSDAFDFVTLALKDEHGRTPDPLVAGIPAEIPLNIRVNTFELDNSDENTGDVDVVFTVRPDADVPTLTASITPDTGQEDAAQDYELTISGQSPDPHETVRFEVAGLPDDGVLLLNGTPLTIAGGIAEIPSVLNAEEFVPDGTLIFRPGPGFSGDVTLSVTAISSDTNGSFTDTETSVPSDVLLEITPTGDLEVTPDSAIVVIPEGDGPDQPDFRPADEVAITVTDPSEFVTDVVFTLNGVPPGTAFTPSSAPVTITGSTFSFDGSLAEFNQLEIQFPVNFSTDGPDGNTAPLSGSLNVKTNEGGDETTTFSVEVTGELDLSVTVTPSDLAQTGAPLVVPLGIEAVLDLPQSTGSESIDQIVIAFDAPLADGTTVSAGTLSSDRQTLTVTRGIGTTSEQFAATVMMLAVTVPGTFSSEITGTVTGTSNHGSTAPIAFSIDINDQPTVTGPVDLGETTDPTVIVSFDDLLANTDDPDGPLTLTSVSTNATEVTALINGDTVELTIADGFAGPVVLTYDVADAGSPVATTSASATLDVVNEIDVVPSATDTVTGPGGVTIPVVENATGLAGQTDIAKGSDLAEAVIYDAATRDYSEIDGFQMLGGDDLVDLTGATTGFTVDMGAGADNVTGGSAGDVLNGGEGADILNGGAGADTLAGGTGNDIFVLSEALDITDVISDYEPGSDQIDLSQVLIGSDDISGDVTFDAASGTLTVLGDPAAQIARAGGGALDSVEVIFEDASGAQATAVI